MGKKDTKKKDDHKETKKKTKKDKDVPLVLVNERIPKKTKDEEEEREDKPQGTKVTMGTVISVHKPTALAQVGIK